MDFQSFVWICGIISTLANVFLHVKNFKNWLAKRGNGTDADKKVQEFLGVASVPRIKNCLKKRFEFEELYEEGPVSNATKQAKHNNEKALNKFLYDIFNQE